MRSFEAPHLGTPTYYIRMNLIPSKSSPWSGLHFTRWYGSIFFQIITVSSERRIIGAVECGKVVQGHTSRWFWDQLKGDVGLPLMIKPWLCFAPFLRYSELLVKNDKFSLPHLIYRPRSGWKCSLWWSRQWRSTVLIQSLCDTQTADIHSDS